MKKFIHYASIYFIGLSLASLGVTLFSWQFWVVGMLLAVVTFTAD